MIYKYYITVLYDITKLLTNNSVWLTLIGSQRNFSRCQSLNTYDQTYQRTGQIELSRFSAFYGTAHIDHLNE